MTGKDFLSVVHTDERGSDPARFYDDWAATYDADVEGGGYVTPKRCAEALARFAHAPGGPAPGGPVADLGCGTGLSGEALRAAGFDPVDGYDVSDGMLKKARGRGCYRGLAIADLSDPDTIPDRGYAHAALIGVVGPNFVGTGAIDLALGLVPAGGCVVLNMNDKALCVPEFPAHVHGLADRGAADLVFEEHGPHIPGRGMGSTVFVLRRR